MKDTETAELDRWRKMAQAENARARQAWGFRGQSGWSEDPGAGSTPSQATRAERNRKVLALSGAGYSIPEIARQTGVANTTVWRILHGKPA